MDFLKFGHVYASGGVDSGLMQSSLSSLRNPYGLGRHAVALPCMLPQPATTRDGPEDGAPAAHENIQAFPPLSNEEPRFPAA